MICPACNSELSEGSLACPFCGCDFTKNNQKNQNNYQQNNYPSDNIHYQYQSNEEFSYQYQYTPPVKDAGESDANIALTAGIVSFFFGIIPAVISLVFASKYKKTGNGQNEKKAKAGKICSLISIIGRIASVIVITVLFFATMNTIDDFINDIPVSDDVIIDSDYEDEYNDTSDSTMDIFVNGSHFDFYESIYYTETNEKYNESDELLLYEKNLPESGISIYDSKDITILINKIYITKDDFKTKFKTEVTILADEKQYDFSVNQIEVDGQQLYGNSFVLDKYYTISYLDDFEIGKIDEVVLPIDVFDMNTNELINTIYITIPL